MSRRSSLHASLVLLLLLSACAPKSSPLPVIPLPPQRMEQTGYSFLPLDEQGWSIAGRDEQQAALMKKGDKGELTIIQARLLELPLFETVQDMAIWVRQEQQQDALELPFVLLKHNVWPVDFKDGDCVRSVMNTEDSREGLLIELHGITCPHPMDVQIGISLIYSQRHEPDRRDPLLTEKADLLFKSLQFLPFVQSGMP